MSIHLQFLKKHLQNATGTEQQVQRKACQRSKKIKLTHEKTSISSILPFTIDDFNILFPREKHFTRVWVTLTRGIQQT